MQQTPCTHRLVVNGDDSSSAARSREAVARLDKGRSPKSRGTPSSRIHRGGMSLSLEMDEWE